jgi:hypothetical protein
LTRVSGWWCQIVVWLLPAFVEIHQIFGVWGGSLCCRDLSDSVSEVDLFAVEIYQTLFLR